MATEAEKEIATWMLAEYHTRNGWLPQSIVEGHVRKTYGQDSGLLIRNKNRNWGLSKGILTEFRALTPDESGVVWSRATQTWRKRASFDKPGRMQKR